MNLDAGQFMQLIIALSAGIMLFVAAYLMPVRIVMWVLLLLIPFQIIDSSYGSINLVLTYMVGVSFLLRGHFARWPLLTIVAVIMLAYLLSCTQMLPGTLRDHGLYMIAIVSNFILFYLVYNYVRSSGDGLDMWKILAVLNVLVLIYCVLEVIVGSEGMQFFDIAELEVKSGREEQGYLSGPFRSVALFSDYMAIQSLISIYALMRVNGFRRRLLWLVLLAGNLAFMIASGSRGGILSLAIGLLVFLLLFRKELGMLKMVTWVTTGSLVLVIAGILIVQYTPYNLLFVKLEGTEFVHGVVPDSRIGWISMWDEVVSKPVFGHGPRLRMMNEHNRRIPGYRSIPYPHSLYMYLMYTVGLVGLLAYLWFFAALAHRYWKGGYGWPKDPLLRGFPLLGLTILVMFMASETRIEMFRFHLHAYQQYMFMLFGAFLAFSHLAREQKPTGDKVDTGEDGGKDDRGRVLSRARRLGAGVMN